MSAKRIRRFTGVEAFREWHRSHWYQTALGHKLTSAVDCFSMFQIFAPRPLIELSPRWARKVAGRYPMVFGLSPFAHLFLSNADDTQFAVVVTERPELVDLNSPNREEFMSKFLGSDAVATSFFRRGDYETLVDRLGTLVTDECFYPVPYPALGGSGRLETYARGNAWVHLDLYGQAIGL